MRYVFMLRRIIFLFILSYISCSNFPDYSSGKRDAAPVLNNLEISDSASRSITLDQPTFSINGQPDPEVRAYIGLSDTITVTGNTVNNEMEGDIDVSGNGYEFGGLDMETVYKIIVVAKNSLGYSVKEITQGTGGIAPVMNDLVISDSTISTITLEKPTFTTAGYPLPAVQAYIGIKGTIASSGSAVSGVLQGPVDMSAGSHQFTGLDAYTAYTIIAVAQNSDGYSLKEITQGTSGIAPVLNDLVISNADTLSVTLSQPTFSTAGNPVPTVQAYIGLSGAMSVSGTTVSNSLQGPVDVSAGAHQFNGLNIETAYDIIVVAQNAVGNDVKQITQSTADKPKAQWARSDTGTAVAPFNCITTDTDGNIYAAGLTGFTGSSDFGNGVTITIDKDIGLYLVKYNSSGQAQWAWISNIDCNKFLYSCIFKNIVIDSNRNVYVIGEFSGSYGTDNESTDTFVYDFGNGVTVPRNSISDSMILVKYNSSGTIQWVKNLSGYGIDYAYTNNLPICVDSSGNLYICRYVFTDAAGTFDFGNGVTIDDNNNKYIQVIIKCNSSGVTQWAKIIPDTALINTITADSGGNIYSAGYFRNSASNFTANFGNGIRITTLECGPLIVKYTSGGTAKWAKVVSIPPGSIFNSITTDTNGNIYALGTFEGTGTYNIGDGLTITGICDSGNLIVVKCDSSGTLHWAQTEAGETPICLDSSGKTKCSAVLNSIAADSAGNVYVAGQNIDNESALNFGNGITTAVGDSIHEYELLLINYDSSGKAQWEHASTTVKASASGLGICLDSVTTNADGAIYAAGGVATGGAYDFGNDVTLTQDQTAGSALLVKYR